jgi:hypothetical protein
MNEDTRKWMLAGLVGILIGAAIGLFIGWYLWPVEWINATPEDLRTDLQNDYMMMTIDSFRVNGDSELAAYRYGLLGEDAVAALEAVAPYQDPNVLAAFEQAIATVPAVTPEPTPLPGPTENRSLLGSILIALGVIAILLVIGGLVYYLFRSGRGSGERSVASKANEYSKSVQKTNYQAMGAEPPVAQFVTTYMLGDDLFDDSFSIDSPAGEFLGECGVGISETIGVGDPKRVTAFEVWIFDKNDIQTVTKVLMSPHAFSDPAMRAKLESKGELIELTPGKEVVLETATLQLSATVADSQFGEGPLPPQSFYDRMTLELAIWTKVQ